MKEYESITAPYSERLPDSYNDERILSKISSDGQLYATNIETKREIRIETNTVPSFISEVLANSWFEYVKPPPEKNEGSARSNKLDSKSNKRKQSNEDDPPKNQTFYFTRHLLKERWICKDCGMDISRVHFLWVDRRCIKCGSARISASDKIVEPPFPNIIENYGFIQSSLQFFIPEDKYHGHIWGEDPYQDTLALATLRKAYRFAQYNSPYFPLFDNHCHLYLLMLFIESLSDFVESETLSKLDLYNYSLEFGNVYGQYFQFSGDPKAARKMLIYYLKAIEVINPLVIMATAKHSYGMGVLMILNKYTEEFAEQSTNITNLRQTAIKHVRESLEIILGYRNSKNKKELRKRIHRVKFALADLLRSGNSTKTERKEAIGIFKVLKKKVWNPVHIRAALAETTIDLAYSGCSTKITIKKLEDAYIELQKLIREPDPKKIGRRVHWANSVGRYLLRHGSIEAAQFYLESAVTFSLKDTPLQIDSMRSMHDSELFFNAFNTLAIFYIGEGRWDEALALLETYRGRTIELSALPKKDRQRIGINWANKQDEEYYAKYPLLFVNATPDGSPSEIVVQEEMLKKYHGIVVGPFDDDEDYKLRGLDERLWELYGQLNDEETLFISLALEDKIYHGKVVLSVIIFGLPKEPPRSGKSLFWTIENDVYQELISEKYIRQSSFREKRLLKLVELIGRHIIQPMVSELASFNSSRAIVVAPGALGNLPFEAYQLNEEMDQTGHLPTRFGFMPSLMFGKGSKPVTQESEQRILILGYKGSDLQHTEEEVQELISIFGSKATYLPGNYCNKKHVIEELNRGYAIIHCICHGIYDKNNPRNSGLYFTTDRIADSFRLTASELREFVRFRNFPMVTLSACSTALVADSKSNTWHGLPGSFLEAGARCVIGARWPVADHLARKFMANLYQKIVQHEGTPLQCFHSTQDDLRSNKKIEEWACFGYLGLP